MANPDGISMAFMSLLTLVVTEAESFCRGDRKPHVALQSFAQDPDMTSSNKLHPAAPTEWGARPLWTIARDARLAPLSTRLCRTPTGCLAPSGWRFCASKSAAEPPLPRPEVLQHLGNLSQPGALAHHGAFDSSAESSQLCDPRRDLRLGRGRRSKSYLARAPSWLGGDTGMALACGGSRPGTPPSIAQCLAWRVTCARVRRRAARRACCCFSFGAPAAEDAAAEFPCDLSTARRSRRPNPSIGANRAAVSRDWPGHARARWTDRSRPGRQIETCAPSMHPQVRMFCRAQTAPATNPGPTVAPMALWRLNCKARRPMLTQRRAHSPANKHLVDFALAPFGCASGPHTCTQTKPLHSLKRRRPECP